MKDEKRTYKIVSDGKNTKVEEKVIRDENEKIIAATTEESLKEGLPEVDLEEMAKKIAERLSIKLKDWWPIMPRDEVEKTILMILNTETEILKEMGMTKMKVRKFRKKPVVIEAYQTNEHIDIKTLEGIMHAEPGDWIISGVNGEQYPCKPDIFKKTYEPVEKQETENKEKNENTKKVTVKNRKVIYTISESLDTIVCPECGSEYVVIGVLRGEEHTQLYLQGFYNYCPRCGKKMDYQMWVHKD